MTASTTDTTLYGRDARAIAPIEHLRFSPLAITRASGCHVTDDAGRDLLDLSAGWSAAAVGYAHPGVVQAVTAAVSSMPGASGALPARTFAIEAERRSSAPPDGTP